MLKRMGANEKVCEDAARHGVSGRAPAARVGLEGTPRRTPDGFLQVPVNEDSCLFEEGIEKVFVAAGGCNQLCKDRSRNHQGAPAQSGIHGGIGQRVQKVIFVP